VLKEAHDGLCRAHQPGTKLGDRLQKLGYYWPKMIPDAIAYAKRCHACHVHGDFIHQAPGHLRSITSTWPFESREWTWSVPSAYLHQKDIGSS